MTHIEIHWCETATDAARLGTAGLPRLDLEPTACTACNARVGEVNGTNDTVFWRPCGLVLTDETVGVLCKKCFTPIDKSLKNR